MAKLQRKSAKVFAEQAQADVLGIAQFGSLAAGNIQYSKDVDTIQALPAYQQGWSAAVVGNKSPALEDRNALDYLLSYQQAYIMQHGVPEWLSTETYYQNSYVVDSNGELRVSIGDNNIGHDPIEDQGGQYWGYAGARGSGKRVGEVYFSQSKLATDNPGALPLFTGDIVNNASNIYPEFYAWVSNHPELCVTQAQYESRTTQYGECPFYVLDTGANTIRLPKLVNYIKMETSAVTQSGAGLPNITGNVKLISEGFNKAGSTSGAFNKQAGVEWDGWTPDGVDGDWGGSFDFNASRSSSVYGSSNTVTPAHTTVFPWVCAYQSAIPASTAQAAEFLQTMSTKVSTEDLSEVVCIVETWHSGTEWCRVWSDGWCEQGGIYDNGSQSRQFSATLTFHKSFQNTNYSVNLTAQGMASDAYGAFGLNAENKQTGSFNANYFSTDAGDGCRYVNWEAKGYINIEG